MRHSTVGWSGWQLIQFVAVTIAIVVIAKRPALARGVCVADVHKPCFAAFVHRK